MVEIPGEIVRLKHISRGLDDNATLQIDVVVSGHVPTLDDSSNVTVLPYVDHFVQLDNGTRTHRPCTFSEFMHETCKRSCFYACKFK